MPYEIRSIPGARKLNESAMCENVGWWVTSERWYADDQYHEEEKFGGYQFRTGAYTVQAHEERKESNRKQTDRRGC